MSEGRTPGRFGVDWRDLRDRSMFFARWSIGASLAMATWKVGAAILTGTSLFWLVNAAFSLGIAAAKYLAVATHRRLATRGGQRGDPDVQHRRIYRAAGGTILVLAGAYVACCLAMLRSPASQRFDQYTAIGIATATFTELGLGVHGLVSARRSADLLVEVVKLSSLAGALVLLVLTQTALISLSQSDAGSYTALAGTAFGALAALIGLYMVTRRLPTPGGGAEAVADVPDDARSRSGHDGHAHGTETWPRVP
ncbi:hypothetical protein [Propionicimonas sp.]|uniref:hypothetical protein n=1 Tax=Propionicimonas sp. TaxID=1955623 RepID=UPI0039E6EF03